MERANSSQSTQPELGEVMDDLQRGLDTASSLDMLIQDRSGSNALILIAEIKACFSRALITLNSSNLTNEFMNQLELPSASSQNNTRRRRNRSRSGAISQEKSYLENPDDCYSWRIYEQEEVQNSRYPRLYYECAHKDELNCRATKTVLQLEEDPSMYEIVCSGQHTCMQLPNEQDL
ncbi:transcription factor WRKY45-1-like isoform X2 [Carex rostrata]